MGLIKNTFSVWSYGCYPQSPFKCTDQYINISQIALSNWVKLNWTSQGAGSAICLDVAMVAHFASCRMFWNHKPVFSGDWHGLFGLIWGKNDRTEQVDISHLKNWKNWAPQDTADITLFLNFSPWCPGVFGIKFQMKTFTRRAWHRETEAYVSDLPPFQSSAEFPIIITIISCT